jgi:hypothetical protein
VSYIILVDFNGHEYRFDGMDGWRVMEIIRASGLPIRNPDHGVCEGATAPIYVAEIGLPIGRGEDGAATGEIADPVSFDDGEIDTISEDMLPLRGSPAGAGTGEPRLPPAALPLIAPLSDRRLKAEKRER